MFGFILPSSYGFANDEIITEQDGAETVVINKANSDVVYVEFPENTAILALYDRIECTWVGLDM